MSISKVGITITLWDEKDMEMAKVGDWIDPAAIQQDRRAIYEEVCAAAWPILNSALDAARDSATTLGATHLAPPMGISTLMPSASE